MRQRLAEASGGSPFIATVRGLGFRWENLTDCNRRDDIRGAHRDARVPPAVLDGSVDLRFPSRANRGCRRRLNRTRRCQDRDLIL